MAEQNTQQVLIENELCMAGCRYRFTGSCLAPYSLVLFARIQVGDLYFAMSCDELSDAWSSKRQTVEDEILNCVADLKRYYDPEAGLPESCPTGFSPTLVDEMFGETNEDGSINRNVRYTSSIFATLWDLDLMYNIAPQYDNADDSNVVSGAYDTQWEAFVNYTVDLALQQDMIIAAISGAVTALAILVHSRSPWLTFTGLLQIILSLPLAYFVYNLVAGLTFL